MDMNKKVTKGVAIALEGATVAMPMMNTVSAMEKNATIEVSYEENYINNLDSYEISLEDQKILASYNEDAVNSAGYIAQGVIWAII